jgi:SP family galactose:H+ symporter-like MFS transporter
VFAVICLGGIAFTLLRVPETTGQSLEAIEKHLSSGKPLVLLGREALVSATVAGPSK